jgi:hypothetical protein
VFRLTSQESRLLKSISCTFTDTTTFPTTTYVTNEIITTPFGEKVNYTVKLGKKGLPEGYGIGHYFDLNFPYVYKGFWFHGNNNGQGEAVWENGDIFSGRSKDGFKNGRGTYKWSDGSVYEGNLKHFDLVCFKLVLFWTKSVHKLQCNLECNPVMNKRHIVNN